ncbi:hypothetical protein ACS0TY_010221 [Phlomoides rotata]
MAMPSSRKDEIAATLPNVAMFQSNETIAIPSNTHPESGPMDELPDVAYPGTKRDLIEHYRLGWSMGDEQDLVDCLESQLLGREITSPKLYMRFLGDHFGREGASQALCRLGKFEFYQQAYYIFDVKGVETYAIDGPHVVRQGIPADINLHGQLMNRYVSYYHNHGGMNDLLTRGNHYDCLENLRVDRNAFGRLCIILRNCGGLVDGKHVSVEEQVSMFLGILVHHKKNRVMRYTYNRSGQTVSHYVHLVLTVILQLHSILLCHSCRLLTPTCNAEDLRMAANDGPLPGKGSFKKPTTNTRNIWTTREEKVLINVLKELVNKCYKLDNSFRTGYLIKCEEALKADFPKTDLQTSPHITSKLTSWKKSYSSLVTAHTTTGVGFSTTTSQLELSSDDQWESIIKSYLYLLQYAERSSYERHAIQRVAVLSRWVDIFGLDRATSSVAEDVVEMAKRLKLMYEKLPPVVENQEHDGVNYGSEPHGSDGIDRTRDNDPTEGDSTAHGASNIARDTTNGARKKHKMSPETHGPSNMERLLGEFCHTTGERLATIAGRIGYEHDLGSARKLLFEQLDVVPGMSIKDKLKASVLIGEKVEIASDNVLDVGGLMNYD